MIKILNKFKKRSKNRKTRQNILATMSIVTAAIGKCWSININASLFASAVAF